MTKLKDICVCFGAIFVLSTVAVNGHLNLFLNQHEVMRLLGKFKKKDILFQIKIKKQEKFTFSRLILLTF